MVRFFLLLAAVLCFLLAVFHAAVNVDLIALGLAFFAASFFFDGRVVNPFHRAA